MIALTLVLVQAKTTKPVPLPTGQELLKKMRSTLRDGSPVTGSLETVGPSGNKVTMTFRIMYPGLFWTKMSAMGTASEVHWTKANMFSYIPSENMYMKLPRPANAADADIGLIGFESLFNDYNYFKLVGSPAKAQFQGMSALSLPVTRTFGSGSASRKYIVYVDPKTYLPLGFEENNPEAGGKVNSTYKAVTLKAKLTAKDFEWLPPKGATAANEGN